jgi:hypothetical protein
LGRVRLIHCARADILRFQAGRCSELMFHTSATFWLGRNGNRNACLFARHNSPLSAGEVDVPALDIRPRQRQS